MLLPLPLAAVAASAAAATPTLPTPATPSPTLPLLLLVRHYYHHYCCYCCHYCCYYSDDDDDTGDPKRSNVSIRKTLPQQPTDPTMWAVLDSSRGSKMVHPKWYDKGTIKGTSLNKALSRDLKWDPNVENDPCQCLCRESPKSLIKRLPSCSGSFTEAVSTSEPYTLDKCWVTLNTKLDPKPQTLS